MKKLVRCPKCNRTEEQRCETNCLHQLFVWRPIDGMPIPRRRGRPKHGNYTGKGSVAVLISAEIKQWIYDTVGDTMSDAEFLDKTLAPLMKEARDEERKNSPDPTPWPFKGKEFDHKS